MNSGQMHHQLIPPLLLSFFLILPVSLSVTDERYTNCHRQFECGDIQNVYYPFWGNPSPSYCGLLEFELECIDGFPVMEILSEKFRVLMINHETHYMRIARLDLLNNTCPSLYVNTTISYLFNYAANHGNLTLFYGCSSPTETLASNSFRCRVNDTSTESGYFMVGSIPADENPGKCSGRIHVPILPTATKALMSNSSSLSAVLNDGFEVQWIIDYTACTECLASGGRCGYNTTWVKPICFCPDEPYLMRCPNPAAKSTEGRKMTLSNKIVIAVSVFGACIIVVTTVLIYFLRRKSSWNKSIVFWKKKAKNAQNVEAFLENYESIAPKRYSYPEVKKMTESFKDKLGQGGYGGVYKGKLLDGRLVAVKVLSDSKGDGEEFLNEVVSISRTSHVNIVSLLGFCFEGLKRALIYEFMPNGSLEKFIYDEKPLETNPPLGWKRLYQVAVGIARGLEYLHRGCNTRILHLDIKPQNILLDQDFCPKISDFGLAKLCTRKESAISMMGARGTVGYIAPEVFSRNFGLVSHKSDVYSYGMMVLEMVGRRKNIDSGVDHSSEVYFPHWIYKRLELDEDLRLHWIMTREGEEVARKMIIVGLWCIQTDPSKRPSMSKVLDMLGGSFEALRIPPKPFPSSPLRSPEDASFTSHSSLFLASDDELLPPQQLQDHALPQCI